MLLIVPTLASCACDAVLIHALNLPNAATRDKLCSLSVQYAPRAAACGARQTILSKSGGLPTNVPGSHSVESSVEPLALCLTAFRRSKYPTRVFQYSLGYALSNSVHKSTFHHPTFPMSRTES